MKNLITDRDVRTKKTFGSFILLTLLFVAVGIFMVSSIHNHYLSLRTDEVREISRGYSAKIAVAVEAEALINRLLEDRIEAALQTTALNLDDITNESLEELVKVLHVDEIDFYSAEGELVYSNLEELIGWKIYENHPIDLFLKGPNRMQVEEIRRDVVSNDLLKYGYLRFDDGTLIQVGIKAEKIERFLEKFEHQTLLEEMLLKPDIVSATLVDNERKVVATTLSGLAGQVLSEEKINQVRENPEDVLFPENDLGVRTYLISTPVMQNSRQIATLAIRYNLFQTDNFIRKVSLLGMAVLITLYIFNLYILINMRKKNDRLVRTVYYDRLTGLPNSAYMDSVLQKDMVKQVDSKKAILLINFEQFKIVNITLGYEQGDFILDQSAQRLRALETSNLKLFKLDADRFIMYVSAYDHREELLSLVRNIREVFSSPFMVSDNRQYMQVKIGILELDKQVSKSSDIIQKLSIALNHLSGKDSLDYAFFSEEMSRLLVRKDMIEKELREVVQGDDEIEFYMNYQPLVDARTGKVRALEALARMNSAQFGPLSPLEFIGIAEERHLIEPLGRIILEKACSFARKLADDGCRLRVFVNISAIQLLRDDFLSMVMKTIKEAGISCEQLGLEITESAVLDNFTVANQRLQSLQLQGIQIALDDFGVGFSSFYRLEEMYVDIVKIDKFFVDKIGQTPGKLQISEDIISMAHKYNLSVTAEGVETKEQLGYLQDHGCNTIQGYYYSRPLSEVDALAYCQLNKCQEED